jgi:branched-chain amino acid aminotransferase
MAKLICYVNGNFTPLEAAYLPVQDLAILRGYGVFDFLRTYNGKPFKLPEHLTRLARSASLIHLDLPKSLEEIERIVLETLARNTLPEANIRVVVTGGVSLDSVTPAEQPSLIVLITPLHEYPAEYYEQGVRVITVEMDRYIPWAKTINYIPAIIALKQARSAGAIEALYVNPQKQILEGTTSNFFVFQGTQLITPKDNILPGVTRDVVLELAQGRFEIVQRPLTFADLAQAEEAFLTASNKEIMPVHHVDDVQIGPGKPGSHTRWLMACFRQFTANDT